jgi:pimeloyl-ACP methyl ester carboxylesterase
LNAVIELFEPIEGYLGIGDYRLHHLRWGDKGNHVVLLHSMGVDAYSMDLLAESLAVSHRVLALTILGHGDSTVPSAPVSLPEHAELLFRCIRELGYTPCVLVGHSVGGRLSMILSAEHPADIRGVVLVDIAPPDPVPTSYTVQAPSCFKDEEEVRAYLRQRYPRFTDHYVENRIRHGFIERADGSIVPKPTGNEYMRDMSTDLWPYVEKMGSPTLLVLGSESTLVTTEKHDRMRKSIPGLGSLTVEGATHMVPQDRPEEFKDVVKGFLGKIKW